MEGQQARPYQGMIPGNESAPESGDHRLVRVDLGQRSYDIVIGAGLIKGAGARIAALAPGAKCAVVTDETVAALHLEPLLESLRNAGVGTTSIVLPAGEATKCFDQLAPLSQRLLEAEIDPDKAADRRALSEL